MVSDSKVTISFPYAQLLRGLEKLCGLRNVSFGSVHDAAKALPILLSTVCLDNTTCDHIVEIGSIDELADSAGNKILQADLIPEYYSTKARFLEYVVKLQTALSELP